METSVLSQPPNASDSGMRPWGTGVVCLGVLAAGVSLLAFIVPRFGNQAAFGRAGNSLLNINGREAWEAAAVAVALLLAVVAPRFGRKSFGRMEKRFSEFAA